MKKTVRDVNWEGKTAVMRCDFNVPLKDGSISDDTRIRAALPTIKYLIENGARVVVMSHLGRPKGKAVPEMSLAPVAERLSEYIGKDVKFVPSDVVVDDNVKAAAKALSAGDVMLIEKCQIPRRRGKRTTLSLQRISLSLAIFSCRMHSEHHTVLMHRQQV